MGVFAVTHSDFDLDKAMRGFEKERRKRALQKTNKQKAPHSARGPRRRDWEDLLGEGDPTLETGFERVMPRGERERRRAVETAAASGAVAGAAGDEAERDTLDKGLLDGRVIEAGSGVCRVRLADGTPLLCELRGSLEPPPGSSTLVAAGDHVRITPAGGSRGVVEAIVPRMRCIVRPDPSNPHLNQVIAANVDQLLIVAAWRQPSLWPELIDRYLVAAARAEVAPLLCVNKIDLVEDPTEFEATAGMWRALGVPVLLTSALSGVGLEALRGALDGRVTALAGLSGVGKSSLLSAADPAIDLRVGMVNEERGQGRHTTTQALMLPLSGGGYVIDTPGIREFGLSGLAGSELAAYYPEIAEHAAGCRFSDCTHNGEPDCAVRRAVDQGAVSALRYDTYCKIRATLPA